MRRYTHLHEEHKTIVMIEDESGEFVLLSDVKRKLADMACNLNRAMDAISHAQRQPHNSIHHENIELRLAVRKNYDDLNNLLRGVK